MNIQQAKNVVSLLKLPKGWKIQLHHDQFYKKWRHWRTKYNNLAKKVSRSRKHSSSFLAYKRQCLRQYVAMTGYTKKTIYVNHFFLPYMNGPDLFETLIHELGHVKDMKRIRFDSSSERHHDRIWYNYVRRYGFDFENDYQTKTKIAKRHNHPPMPLNLRRRLRVKNTLYGWLKGLKHCGFYVPSKYEAKHG